MFNIDQLLRDTDLPSLVERYQVQLRQVSGEWRGPCPIHRGDNDTGFVVFEEGGKQKWHCFTRDCGSGDAIDFIQKMHGCDFPEACRMLGGEDADPLAIKEAAQRRMERAEERLRESIAIANKALGDMQAARSWETYHEYLEDHPDLRNQWEVRGIPDTLQNWWQLGYRQNYKIHTKAGWWGTPTLTIPIFEPGWTCINVRHRLLNPYSPNDKYRPERAGLGSSPFIADPDIGYDTERILVVEGEIKSMVTWLTMDEPGIQVIGIPGKGQFGKVLEQIKGRSVYICFDPDATDQAEKAARLVDGRVIRLPEKIDDLIIKYGLGKGWALSLLKTARKVK